MSFSTSTYRFNPLPSIALFVIFALIGALALFGLDFYFNAPHTLSTWGFAGLFALLVFIISGLDCYIDSHSYLTINNREIVYRQGWLNISTTTIDVRNVRSCRIDVSIIQRMFNASTIVISTAGEEITFRNASNGELLYQQINDEIAAFRS